MEFFGHFWASLLKTTDIIFSTYTPGPRPGYLRLLMKFSLNKYSPTPHTGLARSASLSIVFHVCTCTWSLFISETEVLREKRS